MNKLFSRSWRALFCAALLLAPIVAHAQEEADDLDNPLNPTQPRAKLLIGPRVGLTRNYHTGGFHTLEGANCPKFESGSGWGFLGGLTAEFIPGNGNWSIVPAITFDTRPGNFKQRLPDVLVLLDTIPVNQTISTTSDVTYQLASAEVMYKQEIWQPGKSFRVSVSAGPVGSYVLGGKISQYNDLEEPQNARFAAETVPPTAHLENNGRRMVFSDNEEIPGRSSIRFSLKGGLQAEIGLFNNQIMMYPGVFYDFGLTHVTSQENWNLNSMLFQVDIRRAF